MPNNGHEGTGLGWLFPKAYQSDAGKHLGREQRWRWNPFFVSLARADSPTKNMENFGDLDGLAVTDEPGSLRTVALHRGQPVQSRLVETILQQSLKTSSLIPAMDGRLGLIWSKIIKPDLVLLDLDLPGMHGYQVLKMLQDDPVSTNIPVIVVSAGRDRATDHGD